MQNSRPYSRALDLLRSADLRPTRQRLALAKLLFEGGDRHVTAEKMHEEAIAANISVSLATVYNTLHQFTASGLLREIMVDGTRFYFDTNTSDHHHFFFSDCGRLEDIPADDVIISRLPPPPDGAQIARIDVIVRVVDSNKN
ncbi:MAG: transcriptional repressor [Rhodospirillales bacterium]|nr:transcriptional repressor [Rhodospirillales bacterium]